LLVVEKKQITCRSLHSRETNKKIHGLGLPSMGVALGFLLRLGVNA